MASHNRTHASDRGKVIPDLPQTPTIGTATAGIQSATVAFTAPVLGGLPSSYTALSSPGSITGTGTSSPVTVTGLTAGTAYTFTIRSNNATGSSEYSFASNSITALAGAQFESIATVSVGAGGTGTISFTSIPSTYKHLQVRLIGRTDRSGNPSANMLFRFNNDSSTNYNSHALYSYGTGVASAADVSATSIIFNRIAGASAGANMFGSAVVDIYDYANGNKYTTARNIGGLEINGSGSESYFESGTWRSTSAINRIDITSVAGSVNFVQYSHFALYGIKG